MFRIVCDPSSGSIELYLTEITRSGSLMFVVCLVGVGSLILNQWCVCARARVCVCVCVCVGKVRRAVPARHTAHTHTAAFSRLIKVIYSITLRSSDRAK